MEQRPRPTARGNAGRASVGLALAATTAVGMAAPAVAAPAAAAATAAPAVVGATARAVRPPAAPVMTYQVRAGDTVSHIALRTGTSVPSIVSANGLGPSAVIRVGQMLKIPSPGRTAAPAPASRAQQRPAVPAAAARTHTVRAGETVSGLAKQYGTTVSAIVSANGLRSDGLIRVGQVLTVSGNPAPSGAAAAPAPTRPAARTHTVRPGDTVSDVAKQYGTSVGAIVAANSLRTAGVIYVGQVLTVSGTAAPAPAAPTPAPAPAPSGPVASGTYTVRAGDTVSGLAKSWGTSASSILQANRLSSAGLIYVGQKLTVPGTSAGAAPSLPADQLVPDSFMGRRYPQATVASANTNKAALLAAGVPSRAQMQALVAQVARQMGVDPALAQAHAYQESGFNHASVSPANAVGTMQVIPSSGEWAADLVGRKLNLLDPYDNVVAGVAIIRQLQRTSADVETGIAGYYQGAGSVARNGLYADTRMYVDAVTSHMRRF